MLLRNLFLGMTIGVSLVGSRMYVVVVFVLSGLRDYVDEGCKYTEAQRVVGVFTPLPPLLKPIHHHTPHPPSLLLFLTSS